MSRDREFDVRPEVQCPNKETDRPVHQGNARKGWNSHVMARL